VSFLEVHALTKTFPDGTRAVRGIDLAAEEGEFIVLLGPSGCGKTTTLRMIAGLEAATSGRIVLGGRDVTSLRPSRRDVGFVFQFYALYPHMTVRDNIAFPLEAAGMSRRERAEVVDAVARGMGIGKLLGRYPRQLSGGDQQRVSLARAVVRKPGLYLMDEPLGTLDSARRLELREFIRRRQQEMGVTTIYVTHDQEEAMSLADRIVVMCDGSICQQGPPMVIYGEPASLFVAEFVGSPGMNFIAGSIASDGARRCFAPDGSPARVPVEADSPAGPAMLGIRPEHVGIAADGPIAGRVVMDEYQGTSRCVHVDAGFPRNVVARLPAGHQCAIGSAVRLSLDSSRLRFFDSRMGQRL